MEANTAVFMISVFSAGILSFFSPCIFPLLPVYMTSLMEDNGEKGFRIGRLRVYWKPIVKTLCFILGISMVFFLLGFGAGSLGKILNSEYTRYVMGAIVILLGLHQMEIIKIKKLEYQKRVDFNKKKKGDYLGAYLLGLTFSFGWTPCIGPVLGSVLAVAASGTGSSSLYGTFLMLVYSLGLAIPFLILAIASSVMMKYFGKIKKHMVIIKKVGGGIIVLMGVILILGKLNFLTTFMHS